ncbi:MAG: cadmium-translocating P-type ATPase [Bacteroidales bacterium]|nr:cadmium-translocating P-type ATPase [Bacteroidales bacterium]
MAHEHHLHEEYHSEEGSVKKTIIRIAVSSLLLAVAVIIEKRCNLAAWQLLLVFLVPYLVAGFDTLKEAAEGLSHGEALDENFLMGIATAGALCIGFLPEAEPQFAEAVFVMLFFQIGELFETIAEGRSRRSIAHLMDIRPDTANLETDGSVEVVSPDSVQIGAIIVIKPGEKVPMDGVVIEGTSSVDTVAISGESVPRKVAEGEDIYSGCVNLGGVLRVRVTKSFGESTASRILELVEHAADSKSRSENFITRFAKVYTPIVVVAALLLAIVPPLFGGNFATWLYRALMFLVVSCPCALVLSVPLSFFGGIGGASRKGILIKGSNYLEALSKLDTVVFDKTGTLTEGVFEVTAVHPEIIEGRELLHLAAHVERFSTHPIAASLRAAYPEENDDCRVENVEEVAGKGIKALVNGRAVCVGNSAMMEACGANWHACHKEGTIIHVCIDSEYVGHIVISDRIKADSAEAMTALKAAGVSRTVMLTGDREAVGISVASQLGIDECYAGLMPADKVAKVEMLLGGMARGRKLAFVGDGINDAPVLARADVGIAMGALGSDAAIEAADVVLMDDKPSKLAQAVLIARRTIRIARENTWFAIGIKLLVLILAAAGIATMWMAVFADVGVTVLAILNAMRALQ